MDNRKVKSFEYDALDASREIRLLRVSATEDSDNDRPITSSLFHVKLDDCPSYIALSYVWGDAKETLPISVNGSVVSIAKNLQEALSALRQTGGGTEEEVVGAGTPPLPLWIDALCINQSDDAEKAVQVQLMQRIYRDAAQVFIWLGPAGGDSAAAMALLRDVGTAFQRLRDGPLYALRAPTFLRSIATTRPGPGLRGVWYLFRRRPYWRRVWVIQEAVLARRATLWCGSDALDWDTVLAALRAFQLAVSLPRPEAATTAAISILADVNQDLSHFRVCAERFQAGSSSNGGGMALMETLYCTLKADIQSTDPRDRIFGLLGLVRDEDRALVPVDYSASTTLADILLVITRVLLRKHGPEILCYCAPSLAPESLPSWVVDWTAQKEVRLWTKRIGGAWADDGAFNASKGLLWDGCSVSSISREPVLILPGVIVGSVDQIGSEFTTSSNSPEYLQACRAWLIELRRMVSHRDVDPLVADERLSNLWRLPIADKSLAGDRTSPDDEAPIHYNLLMGTTTSSEVGSTADSDSETRNDGKDIIDKTFEYRRRWYLYDRRPFTTNGGHPGLTLSNVNPGDKLCVLAGCTVPFVIRPQRGGKFKLVGEAYVYGLMDGEAVMGDSSNVQDIHLI